MSGLPNVNQRAIADRRIQVKIERVRVKTEYPVDVLTVVVSGTRGEWHYACGSEAELKTLLDGMRIGVEMLGGSWETPDMPSTTLNYMTATPKTT